MTTRYKTLKIKTAPTNGSGRFTGILAATGLPADFQNESFDTGAFTNSILDWLSRDARVPIFFNHRTDSPDSKIGEVVNMWEAPEGLMIEGQLNLKSDLAVSVYEALLNGSLDSLSIGYSYVNTYEQDGVLHITRADVIEATLTSIPAEPRARITSVKSASAFAPAQMTDDNSQWRCSCGKYGKIPMMPTTALGERVYVGTCVGCGRMWGVTPFEKSRHVAAMREVKARQIWAALDALRGKGTPTDVLRSALASARFAVNDIDYTVADFKSRLFDLVDGAVDEDAVQAEALADRAVRSALDDLEAEVNVGTKRRHHVPNEDDRVSLGEHLRRFHGNQVKPEALVRMNLRELQAVHRACHPEFPFDSTESVSLDVSTLDAPKSLSPQAVKFLAEYDAAERGVKSITDQERTDHERFLQANEELLAGPIPSPAQEAAREAARREIEDQERERLSNERDQTRANAEAADDASRNNRGWRQGTSGADYYTETIGAQPVPDTPRAPMPEPIVHDGTVAGLGESFVLPAAGFIGEDGRLARQADTTKPDTYRIADGVENRLPLGVATAPVLPLKVAGEGETVRVNTAQRANDNRRVEKK